jgi:hypothetical protein
MNGGLDAPSADAAALRAKLLALARTMPAPTRAEVVRRRWLGAVVLSLFPLALFHAWGGLRGGPRPSLLILETAGGAALIAIAATAAALSRGGAMLGRSRHWLLAVAVLTPLSLLAYKLSISAGYSDMVVEWPERPGFRCLLLSSALTAMPLLGALFLLRRSDPVHPGLLGLALGAALGACSWVLVDLWCPVAHLQHLLLGHTLPLLIAAALGALIGRCVLSPR